MALHTARLTRARYTNPSGARKLAMCPSTSIGKFESHLMSSMACSSGRSVKYCVGDAVVSDDPGRYGVVGFPGDHLEAQFLVCDPATRAGAGKVVAHLKFESVCEHGHSETMTMPARPGPARFRMLDGSSFVQKCDETAECRRMFPWAIPELVSDEEDDDEIAEEMADLSCRTTSARRGRPLWRTTTLFARCTA